VKARLVLILIVLVATLLPAAALAQAPASPGNAAQLSQRQATYGWEKQANGPDLLMASFSFVDVVDSDLRRRLASGLPSVIVMRAYVLRDGEPDPVALAARTCVVTFDLWDELYRLKISDSAGQRNVAANDERGVLRQCFEARRVTLAERPLLTVGKPHFLGVIVEVNPVDAQMVDQMRKWVSRPAGSTGIGPGDALFGSFVGLFMRQISTAYRTLRFRTQTVTP
jgi:hypothetical protein